MLKARKKERDIFVTYFSQIAQAFFTDLMMMNYCLGGEKKKEKKKTKQNSTPSSQYIGWCISHRTKKTKK